MSPKLCQDTCLTLRAQSNLVLPIGSATGKTISIVDVCKDRQEEPEYQGILSTLYLWLGAIDEIDEDVKDWAMLTARYIRVHWYETGLIKELAKHVDRTPENVGALYIEMLSQEVYPDYERQDIEKIVITLYEQGCKKQADTICNMYGEAGYYFLRQFYERYNKGPSGRGE